MRKSPTRRKSRARRPVRFDLALGALTVPAIALILAFSVLPVLYVAYLSLWDLRFGAPLPGEFAGWGNYRFILGDASVMTLTPKADWPGEEDLTVTLTAARSFDGLTLGAPWSFHFSTRAAAHGYCW